MLRYLVLVFLCTGCSLPRVWTTQRMGPVSIDGDIAISGAVANGSTSTDQLNLDDDDLTWSPRIDADAVGFHLNANRFATEHEGTGVANANIDFGGVLIPANANVQTDLMLEMNTAAITFDIIPTDLVDIAIGVGGGTLAYDVDILDLDTPGIRIQSTEDAPFGFIAARGASRLGDFLFSIDLAWIDIKISDDELVFLDADAAITYTFFDYLGPGFAEFVLGYRQIDAEIEFDDGGNRVDADLSFSGAYLGLSIGL